MLLIGLTGSIATGKSTVSSLLSQPPHSLPVIDADILARKVVEPGTPGYRKIVQYFLATTPDLLLSTASGSGDCSNGDLPLNRAALGRRVFGDDPATKRDRAVLNGIVHPAVRREIYRALVYHYIRGQWAVVLDVPLLYESGLDILCGVVIVVAVRDPGVQMKRLMRRDAHLTQDEATARVLSQSDIKEKVRRTEARGPKAGIVLWNDGDEEALGRQVTQAVAEIRRASPSWWSRVLLLLPPLAAIIALGNMAQFWRIRRRWESQKERERAES